MHRIPQTPEQRRLHQVIRDAKALKTYPDISWESTRWKILQYDRSRRAHNRDSRDVVFTRRKKRPSDPAVPFAAPYDDFAKAIIRTRASSRGVSSTSQQVMILTLRFLYEPLYRSRLSYPTRLTRRHFNVALEDARKECAEGSAYAIGHTLSEVVVFLNTHRLTQVRIHFKNPIPNPRTGDRLDPASQAVGLKKMPSTEALEVLAAISSHPLDDNEKVLLRIVDLLVVGGFRVGEALTLPRDSWVEQTALNARGDGDAVRTFCSGWSKPSAAPTAGGRNGDKPPGPGPVSSPAFNVFPRRRRRVQRPARASSALGVSVGRIGGTVGWTLFGFTSALPT